MRFWPFGKSDQDDERVEFQSRVVVGTAKDEKKLRGKVTVHLLQPEPQAVADALADEAAAALRVVFEAAADAHEIVADEGELGRLCFGGLRSTSKVRGVDVVAVHVVGEEPHGPMTRRPPSSAPPPMPVPSRRSSSSQMLAVRDSRLIPEGGTAASAGSALVPLLRDAATRVTVGLLRAYDLLVVRRVEVGSGDDYSELVPVSTAAPGRFATERKGELERWEDKLGDEKLRELAGEAHAVVCFFLHQSLEQAGVEAKLAIAVLESAAHSAFPESGPLAELPRYLAVAQNPTDAIAARALSTLGAESELLNSFAVMLAPILASLQEDFSFTANQVKLARLREG